MDFMLYEKKPLYLLKPLRSVFCYMQLNTAQTDGSASLTLFGLWSVITAEIALLPQIYINLDLSFFHIPWYIWYI